MNKEYHLTAMQKIRIKQEKERTSLKKQQSKLQKQRVYKLRRRVAFVVLVLFFMIVIYAVNLLFNDNTKSNALEAPVVSEAPKKEVKIEKKEIKVVPVATQVSAETITAPSEPTIYNENIPMPKEHQEYLYELCEERGLDYQKTLAVIQHESVFDANAVNETNDYGYFQVNLVNHQELSEKLNTDNSPLNPYVNMNWGTFMLADLYSYWGEKGFRGETLDEVVWSSYNKGITGFKNNGHATTYISKMKEAIQTISEAF
jgi:Transglycosylase SLT domain